MSMFQSSMWDNICSICWTIFTSVLMGSMIVGVCYLGYRSYESTEVEAQALKGVQQNATAIQQIIRAHNNAMVKLKPTMDKFDRKQARKRKS